MAYKAGLVLAAMEKRARMLGATMRVYGIIAIGTRIAFNIPFAKGEQGDGLVSNRIGCPSLPPMQ